MIVQYLECLKRITLCFMLHTLTQLHPHLHPIRPPGETPLIPMGKMYIKLFLSYKNQKKNLLNLYYISLKKKLYYNPLPFFAHPLKKRKKRKGDYFAIDICIEKYHILTIKYGLIVVILELTMSLIGIFQIEFCQL